MGGGGPISRHARIGACRGVHKGYCRDKAHLKGNSDVHAAGRADDVHCGSVGATWNASPALRVHWSGHIPPESGSGWTLSTEVDTGERVARRAAAFVRAGVQWSEQTAPRKAVR